MNRREYNITVKEHVHGLFGFALKFLKNKDDADDIVQDVFEKLWLNREKVEFEKAKSWMFTTAYHAMINYQNRSKRMTYDSERIPEVAQTERAGFESKEVVDRAVNILPPIQKSIILLRDIEGYSYEEIGKILEISESQVKVYLFRARNKIKKQLKDSRSLV